MNTQGARKWVVGIYYTMIAVIAVGIVLSFLNPSWSTLTIAVLLWFLLGITIVKEKERGVKIFLGVPYETCESGPRWVLRWFGKIDKYPTGKVQLEMPTPAGILTKGGKYEEFNCGPVNVKAQVVMSFNYPEGSALISVVKQLPPPSDSAALIDLFEEPLLEVVRNEGGKEVWMKLSRERSTFANNITEAIKSEGSPMNRLVIDTGITNVEVSVKHLPLPDGLMDSVDAEEKARLEARGIKIRAEAQRDKTKVEGEGIAAAKKMLLDVLTEKPDNVQAQGLLTLIEMAQGPATTIFPIPTSLVDALQNVTKRDGSAQAGDPIAQIFKMLPEDAKKKIMGMITKELGPKK